MAARPYLTLWALAEHEFPRWIAAWRVWSNVDRFTLKPADKHRAGKAALEHALFMGNMDPAENMVAMRRAQSVRAAMLRARAEQIAMRWLPAKIRVLLRRGGYEVTARIEGTADRNRISLTPADFATIRWVDLVDNRLLGSTIIFNEVAVRQMPDDNLVHLAPAPSPGTSQARRRLEYKSLLAQFLFDARREPRLIHLDPMDVARQFRTWARNSPINLPARTRSIANQVTSLRNQAEIKRQQKEQPTAAGDS